MNLHDIEYSLQRLLQQYIITNMHVEQGFNNGRPEQCTVTLKCIEKNRDMTQQAEDWRNKYLNEIDTEQTRREIAHENEMRQVGFGEYNRGPAQPPVYKVIDWKPHAIGVGINPGMSFKDYTADIIKKMADNYGISAEQLTADYKPNTPYQGRKYVERNNNTRLA